MMRFSPLLSAAAVSASVLFVLPAMAADTVAPLPPVTAADHVRGPATATVTIVEYADLECPFCLRHHATMKALLKAYPKDVKWVFRHFPLSFHPQARPAAIMSECVARLEGEKAFWLFVDAVYGEEGGLSGDRLLPLAVKAGADKAEIEACIAKPKTIEAKIDAQADAGTEAGVQGTPSNFILQSDGTVYATKPGAYPQEDFEAIIKALLAGKPAPDEEIVMPEPAPTPAPEPDMWEDTSDELPPVTAKDHLFGSKTAAVTIVEYGDIECPFCARAHTTMKALVRKNRGQVNWVFRHFPLSFHPQALPSAEAAECVAELKGNAAFWTYLDRLYAQQGDLSASLALKTAQRLRVAAPAYRKCMASDKHLKTIQAQMDAGSAAGVNGTPGFFVIHNKTGEITPISGAVPEETFQSAINLFLKK